MTNTGINVLSAGAVQPGMVKIVEAFQRETSQNVTMTFATAPAILNRMGQANVPDVVIAPLPVLDAWVKTGKAASGDRVTVGRIGVGVMVREGSPLPDITTTDAFKEALLRAASVVYNQASTGTYLEKLFERLGITKQLEEKTTCYPDAAGVLHHIAKGRNNEIGLGATTVIIEAKNKGLKFVGPLPPEIQNYTTYAAAVGKGSAREPARQFVRYLTSDAAKKTLAAAGIE
jgi:molybdate transport system substrate-binding protein